MSSGAPCIVCGFARTGEHEPWCPHFMRGPDPGGDPAEWPTLLEQPEPVITVTIAGAAWRLMHESSPRDDVAVAIAQAQRVRCGRGYRATLTLTRDTADELAGHFESIAGLLGDMTAAEREGGREGGVAARAALALRAALE